MARPQVPPGAGRGEKVVALVPGAAEAAFCARVLSQAGIAAAVYGEPSAFAAALDGETGAVVMPRSELEQPVGEDLRRFLAAQPAWSAVPLVLLCRELPPEAVELARLADARGRVTLLEGPIRVATFLSTVRMALYERRQQFRIRDLLVERAAQVRQRDEFLALLGHELRNPLAAIMICGEVLEGAEADSEHAVSCRHMVREQAVHMKRMLDDLLDISRLTRDKLTVERVPVDLAEILRQCRRQLGPGLAEHAQTLDLELPGEPLPVLGDATRLQQVFVNLLQNAIRYSAEGGRIALSARRTDGLVEVGVRDEGRGMDEETLAHLFEPFYQAESATLRPGQKGLGLGLSLAAKLVNLHGGEIRAHSDGPGRGSEFLVALPASLAELHTTDASPPGVRRAAAPARILLIEDNRELALGLRGLLEARGHEVRLAYDGYEGVAAAQQWTCDAALIDIGLPGIDGYEVARRLRRLAAHSGTRLIALTGYGNSEARRSSAAAGFARHLVKPASVQEIEAAITPTAP